MRTALTIAGSDSGAGAGIQADIKTFAALGVYGTSAITALTAQNTMHVTAVQEIPAPMVEAQIEAVVTDIRPAAVKTGMLANAEIIGVVARKVKEHSLPNLVVDPVMIAKSGDALLRTDGLQALRKLLLPLACVVTPNIPEAEALVGYEIRSEEEVRRAARDIAGLGAKTVVIKGGHREGEEAVDLLWDGQDFREYVSERVHTLSDHGTGCTFASAIAAYLARDEPLGEAVRLAKEYLTGALRHAYPLGAGHGPVHHFYRWWGD